MTAQYPYDVPARAIDVIQGTQRARRGRVSFEIDRDVSFSTEGLQSYAFARWEPVVYDAMVVTAAVEFADRTIKRSSRGWPRRIDLRIPVHEPARWRDPYLSRTLLDALGFLTGDYWSIEFVDRASPAEVAFAYQLDLGGSTQAVLAFSDGLDSRAVAGIIGQDLREKLVRVRVGSKAYDRPRSKTRPEPFTSVPYELHLPRGSKESSARARGFKFAVISGIAAYLSDAPEIIIPESGQGALGPALVPVAHAYRDYRNHPMFTRRMERLIKALFNHEVRFTFPRIWSTKGETLSAYFALGIANEWEQTRSCWRNSQWVSLDGTRRQCGICAACMLRRLSVHAAGRSEAAGTYVAENLAAPDLQGAAPAHFRHMNAAFHQYALAGVLHLDHLAEMAGSEAKDIVGRQALLMAPGLRLTHAETTERLSRMLANHASEWSRFVRSHGEQSFLRRWAQFSDV